jgi:hypothetical protein
MPQQQPFFFGEIFVARPFRQKRRPFMREPNEKIQRLNRTVANVENILPWLNRRLERADKLGADGSPELAR